MKTLLELRKVTAIYFCILLASCGGGSGSGGHSDDGGGTPPPPPVASTEVNFNATVRALATQSALPDNTASTDPMDVNTPTWVFDDTDDAFDDLFL